MRRLTIYLMIFLLFIPQNSIILAESVHDKPESKEVVLLAEHTGEEIEAYSRDDLLLEGLSDYVIPDDTRVLLLTNDKKEDLKVDGKTYSLISYMKENQIVELFVPTDVIITLDLENEFKNKRLHNEKLEEINTNENSTEENDDSSENITDIIENEESDLINTNDNEGVGSASDSDEINEEIKIDPVEETEDIDEKHEQVKRENNKNETISVQSNALTQETSTSKLGHIRSSNVDIYETIGGKSFKAGSKYTNAVYYIKRQAVVGSDTYYLLSTNPSATTGVVGWAKSTDLSTHDHKGVDKIAKVFTIKGTGKATSKAWGGKQDEVHSTLTSHKGSLFQVNLTEKVGKNTWYRGKINGKGSNVWIHSSYVNSLKETSTSKLGHIRSSNVDIYETIGGKSFKAGTKYTNAVYYIKRQTEFGSDIYYLLSTNPSATTGVVGWVKAKDLSTHDHKGVDKKSKTFYLNGNGKATSKAWGGKKDQVHSDLTKQKHKRFVVNLTEKVGQNTWYRGKIDGKGNNVWVHSSYVTTITENKVSKLGHIRNSRVNIYKELGGSPILAGSLYTNAVYYIKKQVRVDDEIYYLISTQPSDSKGVIGWVNAKDLSTHDHKGVDKKVKPFYIKGNGKATSKAWGGSKDNIYLDLTKLKGEFFEVNLTEKVGNNTWYRGKINSKGQNLWLHSSFVTKLSEKNTVYNITLSKAVDIQYGRPIHNAASKKEMEKYLNPVNYKNDAIQKFQFLVLSSPSGYLASDLNKALYKKGTLHNTGRAFYDAAREYKVNEIYLMAHAILETGHGGSELAEGVEVGKDKSNNLVLVTDKNRKQLKEIKKTYNFFGIGALDSDPVKFGAIKAYQNGWFSPTLAIKGGAKWISEGYINNQHKQNTLYKMRWNPNMDAGYSWKQYATDIGWAYKQANIINGIYKEIGFPSSMSFDYTEYK